MAGPADFPTHKSSDLVPVHADMRHKNSADPELAKRREVIREHAAKLYGQGMTRSRVARILVDHLVPNGIDKPEEQRLSQARSKLKRWEANQEFRDMIYHMAVIDLDLATPGILKGIAKKAKRGRVDAARLALEVTGRHNPKGDTAPAQVVVAINGIPRPPRREGSSGVVEIEGEVTDED